MAAACRLCATMSEPRGLKPSQSLFFLRQGETDFRPTETSIRPVQGQIVTRGHCRHVATSISASHNPEYRRVIFEHGPHTGWDLISQIEGIAFLTKSKIGEAPKTVDCAQSTPHGDPLDSCVCFPLARLKSRPAISRERAFSDNAAGTRGERPVLARLLLSIGFRQCQ